MSGIGNASAPEPSIDPVVAAVSRWEQIDQHRVSAQVAFNQFETNYFAGDRDEVLYEAECVKVGSLAQAADRALADALLTAPTSLRGAIALLRAIASTDDEAFENGDIPIALANVLACLERLEERTEPG